MRYIINTFLKIPFFQLFINQEYAITTRQPQITYTDTLATQTTQLSTEKDTQIQSQQHIIQPLPQEQDAREVLVDCLLKRLEDLEKQIENNKNSPSSTRRSKKEGALMKMLNDIQLIFENATSTPDTTNIFICSLLLPFVFCVWGLCILLKQIQKGPKRKEA